LKSTSQTVTDARMVAADILAKAGYMSEERLERIENQIAALSDLVQQNMKATERRLSQIDSRVNSMEETLLLLTAITEGTERRLSQIDSRVNSMEGTLLTAMTEGFASLHNYQIDLDRDLAINEQKTEDNARKSRRLNQRLMHLERRNDDF
jgi:chromosome segregation ATPase